MTTELMGDAVNLRGDPVGVRPWAARRWPLVAAAMLLVAAGVVAYQQSARPPAVAGRFVDEGPAPASDLPRLDDPTKRIDLADFRGRSLVLNFWASWCVPCRKEMPALGLTASRLEGRVEFLGINHQDGQIPAQEFAVAVGAQYPSGFDPAGDVARRYGVLGLPTTIFIDANGRIVGRKLGDMTAVELLGAIRKSFGDDIAMSS